jgi:soluble lytic murein transglycosylase
MKLLLIFTLLIPASWASKKVDPAQSYQQFIDSDKLELTRADHIIAEHMVNVIKLVSKGYVNQEVLSKVIVEVEKSQHFKIFLNWLKSIREISKLTQTSDLLITCRNFLHLKEEYPLERKLESVAGNYCRERSLEAIDRDIEKTKKIADEALIFIHENLKYYLTKKNKKNFAYFLQNQSDRPEILKKLSHEVTTYSVRNNIVPTQEVLKDMLINEQITKLIQEKGFNPLQHKNVFYAEYGKLIQLGYRSLDDKPSDNKIKEHYNFIKNYLELNQDHLPVGLCLNRLNDFSKAVFRTGHEDLSRDIIKYLIKKKHPEIHEDVLYFYLWTYISKKENKEAYKLAKSLNLLNNSKEVTDPRLKFWLGFLHEELDKKEEAIAYYEDIVDSSPLNYYSIMSVKKLQTLKPDSKMVKFYPQHGAKISSPISFEIKEFDSDYISSLVRLKAWAKIDSQRFLKLELKRLNMNSMPKFLVKQSTEKQQDIKSDLHIINAKIISEPGNYLSTFRYLYGLIDKKEVVFNRMILEILYPKPYLDDLTRILKKDSLDPIIVLSLIRQESVFNPHARSPVGARGLMQLMPTTAKRMRRSVGVKQLANPKINIELGTKYFNGLMKRYDGNLVYVLAAYNAGETRVERWKKQYFDTDDTILKNIESIPFLETRNYVKLIFRNIFFYKLLLQNTELADNGEPNKIYDVSLGFKR